MYMEVRTRAHVCVCVCVCAYVRVRVRDNVLACRNIATGHVTQLQTTVNKTSPEIRKSTS